MTKIPPSSPDSLSRAFKPQSSDGASPHNGAGCAAPVLHFAWQDWLPYVESEDVPEEQKRQLIETLWSIVVAFVDLGWQVKDAPESCGQTLDLKTALGAAMLGSDETDAASGDATAVEAAGQRRASASAGPDQGIAVATFPPVPKGGRP